MQIYVLKLLLRLPAEASDQIGREGQSLNGPHLVGELEVGLDRMVAPHPQQDLVVAALGRQVHMVADVGVIPDGLQDLVGEIFRVRRGEPEPDVRVLLSGGHKQVCKSGSWLLTQLKQLCESSRVDVRGVNLS